MVTRKYSATSCVNRAGHLTIHHSKTFIVNVVAKIRSPNTRFTYVSISLSRETL